MKRAILVFLLLSPAVLVPQERNGEIRCSIVDILREPIHTAQVVLRGDGIERTGHVDSAGLYRFIGVPAGEYELTISAPFFYTSTVRKVRLRESAVHVLPPVELVFEGFDCNSRVPAYLVPLDRFKVNRGTLGGIIVDDHGHALSEARVTLFVPNVGVIGSSVTDRNGRFSLMDVPLRSDYKIEVARGGYFTEEFEDFKIQAGYETVYNPLDLEPCEKGRCQSSLRPIRVLPGCA